MPNINVSFCNVSSKLISTFSYHTPIRPHERIDCCDRCIGRRNNTPTRLFLINNSFSSMIKLFAPNMYCWSRKILVATYWTHLRLNDICAKSFCPQKTNNRTLFFAGCFERCRMFINDVTVASS